MIDSSRTKHLPRFNNGRVLHPATRLSGTLIAVTLATVYVLFATLGA